LNSGITIQARLFRGGEFNLIHWIVQRRPSPFQAAAGSTEAGAFGTVGSEERVLGGPKSVEG